MPEAPSAAAEPRTAGARTQQVGDLTRHTQSILERAQAHADAMRAETERTLAQAQADSTRLRDEATEVNY